MTTTIGNRWFVDMLRATIFGVRSIDVGDSWRAVFKSEPDELVDRQRDGIQMCSAIDSNRWVRTIASGDKRTDFVQRAQLRPRADFGTFRKLHPSDNVAAVFVETAKQLASQFSCVDRLALAGCFKLRASTTTEAREQFRRYVPWFPIRESDTDFMVRVNRPVSHASGSINRLATWSFIVEDTYDLATSVPQKIGSLPMIKLDFDFNTSTNREGPLMTSEIPTLFDFMLAELQNLSLSGDPS